MGLLLGKSSDLNSILNKPWVSLPGTPEDAVKRCMYWLCKVHIKIHCVMMHTYAYTQHRTTVCVLFGVSFIFPAFRASANSRCDSSLSPAWTFECHKLASEFRDIEIWNKLSDGQVCRPKQHPGSQWQTATHAITVRWMKAAKHKKSSSKIALLMFLIFPRSSASLTFHYLSAEITMWGTLHCEFVNLDMLWPSLTSADSRYDDDL